MKSIRTIMVFLLLLSLFAMPNTGDAGFFDGNKLHAWAEADDRIEQGGNAREDFADSIRFGAYVVGVHDSLFNVLICTPENVKIRQLNGIVKKHIKDHPERLNQSASKLVYEALAAAFPCKKKSS